MVLSLAEFISHRSNRCSISDAAGSLRASKGRSPRIEIDVDEGEERKCIKNLQDLHIRSNGVQRSGFFVRALVKRFPRIYPGFRTKLMQDR